MDVGDAVAVALAVASGEVVTDADADEETRPPVGVFNGSPVALLHAASEITRVSRTAAGRRALGRPELLVRVVAEVGGRDGRHGVLCQEPGFPAQEVQLRGESSGSIGELQEMLPAGELDLQQPTDRVTGG